MVPSCNGYIVEDMGVMVPADQILQKAVEFGADMVGLSGLITPSLDEMVHVAKEMDRRGMDLPLLIGGATTSKAHTAVKIAPITVTLSCMLDASRAVTVVRDLMDAERRKVYLSKVEEEQASLREAHEQRGTKKLLALNEARANATPIDWSHYTPPMSSVHRAKNPGPLSSEGFGGLHRLVPFFHAWKCEGAILPFSRTPW